MEPLIRRPDLRRVYSAGQLTVELDCGAESFPGKVRAVDYTIEPEQTTSPPTWASVLRLSSTTV